MPPTIDISRPGIAIDLDDCPYRDNPEKTVVVFGLPRGGTTMVAGIVRMCGVHMGEDLPINLEDRPFVGRRMPRMQKAVTERNQLRLVWGWKYPRAADYLQRLLPSLRNPHVIVVWRDLFSTSTRGLRRGAALVTALRNCQKMQQRNIKLLSRFEGPKLMVSYEKGLLRPTDLAEDICAFLSLPATFDAEAIERFAEPGRYKSTDV